MFKICIFIPLSHAQIVKEAMFHAGAGRIGNYEWCSFETLGNGQFRPLKGALPFLGDVGEIEIVQELRVEMVCADHLIEDVVKAMKENHPYEMPAYDIMRLEEF